MSDLITWLVRIDTADKVYICRVGDDPTKSVSRVIKGFSSENAEKNVIKFLKSLALVPDGNMDFAMLLQLYINDIIDHVSKGESYTVSGTHGMSVKAEKM